MEGHFKTLAHVQRRLQEKAQFDCAFLVGRTLANTPEENAELSLFVKGEERLPIVSHFVDSSELAGLLMSAYPEGKEICENLHFLGRGGVK